ncbi:MAG: hypothetical protein H6751_12550 [Candidatus Omnitrophica bacterium]|nr:hypothetical protein [Candidatus Omnitrophota bacterium]MCB9783785.1 hypothetical protein [Candidatus Omnitrophota bacterium]
MTKKPRGMKSGVLAGGLIFSLLVLWLWQGYRHERTMHEQMLIVRGEGVLSALEAGIRSHRRLERWFQSNISAVMEETAKARGILGVAILTEEGIPLATGGVVPNDLPMDQLPRWVDGGLLVGYQAPLTSSIADGAHPMAGGWGRESMNPPESELPEGEVWFVSIVDGSEFQMAVSQDRKRFVFWALIGLGAISLFLATLSLLRQRAEMAVELQLANERESRLEELNRLAAGLAHETKNPLSLIRGMAQTCLNQAPDPEESRKIARKIVDESDRVEGRINSFLSYSRPLEPNLQPVVLAEIVHQTIELFRDEASSKGINLGIDLDGQIVLADQGMVRQILVNLLSNALYSCDSGDSIEVSLRFEDGEGTLTVRDTGCGISQEDLRQVVKPYFTRRPGGTGLGLSIVGQLIKAQGWSMNIESELGQGTTVRTLGLKRVTE